MPCYQILLQGLVQGLGIRPAIVRLARDLGVAGTVCNSVRGVEIEVEGEEATLRQFLSELPSRLPTACHPHGCQWQEIPERGATVFRVKREPAAPDQDSSDVLNTPIPADRSVCTECLAEVFQVGNRRHQYALTTCTQCGPRFTIIQRMPFERAWTAYEPFVLCEVCEREYHDPGSRRFHAQTQACAECGPRIWSVDDAGRVQGKGEQAVAVAAEALRRGQIVALRGLGGYQLLVDATAEEAVVRLRARKRRAAKPLAVLGGSIDLLQTLGEISPQARQVLQQPAGPIVLVPARRPSLLAPSIHPGLNEVGLLLPTSPLHALLCQAVGKPLVCTSGNREGEPLEFEIESSQRELAGIADLWLHHDRSIVRPLDDSVVRVIGKKPTVLRLARGYAPLLLELATPFTMLALSGHMKVAPAWSNGGQAVLGPHLGDLETLGTRQRWHALVADMQRLYRLQPTVWVHDCHPDYYTTQEAEQFFVEAEKSVCASSRLEPRGVWRSRTEQAVRSSDNAQSAQTHEPAKSACVEKRDALGGVELPSESEDRISRARSAQARGNELHQPAFQKVMSDAGPMMRLATWHHHAHLASALLEPGWLDRRVLGVVWDGTGYGRDGTIWGGEFLCGGVRDFQRVGSLRSFALPGGAVAVSQPWRTALALLDDALGADAWRACAEIWQPFATKSECEQVVRLAKHPRLTARTTSAGRLFDAFAMLILGLGRAEFEGQPAMYLEAVADELEEHAYPIQLHVSAALDATESKGQTADVFGRPMAVNEAERCGTSAANLNGCQHFLELDWRPLVRQWFTDWRQGVSPGRSAMRFHRGLAEGIAACCQCWAGFPVVLTGGVFQNRLLSELVIDKLEQMGREWLTHGLIPPNDGGLAAGQLAIAAARLR